jgi:hypothetical protein
MTPTKPEDTLIDKIKIQFLLIVKRLKQEPVLVRTTLALLVSLGFLNLSDADINQIDQAVMVVLVLLGSAAARKRVTPINGTQTKQQRKAEAKAEVRKKKQIKNER